MTTEREALAYWMQQSDGITVGVPIELAHALDAALAKIDAVQAAMPVVRCKACNGTGGLQGPYLCPICRGDGLAAPQEPTEQASPAVPVLWQFRWTNPANDPNPTPSMLEWQEVQPWNPRMQTLEQRIAELRAYTYQGRPAYELRALYAASPPAIAPAEAQGSTETE